MWTLIVTGNGRALCAGADVSKASPGEDDDWSSGIDLQGEPILELDAPVGRAAGSDAAVPLR